VSSDARRPNQGAPEQNDEANEARRAEGRAALALLEATRLADVGVSRAVPVVPPSDDPTTTSGLPEPSPMKRPQARALAAVPDPMPAAAVPEPSPTLQGTGERLSGLEVLMESIETTRRGLELQGIAVARNLRETESQLVQVRQVLPEALQTQANLRQLASAFEAMRVQQTGALNNALGEVQSSLAVWRTNAESALNSFQTASTSLVSSQGREADAILSEVRSTTERELARLERAIGVHFARMDGAQQELASWQQAVQAALQSTMIDAHQRLEEVAVGNLRALNGSLGAISEQLDAVDRDRQILADQIYAIATQLDTAVATVKVWESRIATLEAETLPSGSIGSRVQTAETEVARVSEYNLNIDGQLTSIEERHEELLEQFLQMQRDMRVVAWIGLAMIVVIVGLGTALWLRG
jgi:predicted  nucleic acid-binding Zn-ribbon protein